MCIYSSIKLFFPIEFACVPIVPDVGNATVVNNTGAHQGGFVTYQCKSGMKFDDTDPVKTTYCDQGSWTPNLHNTACSGKFLFECLECVNMLVFCESTLFVS